MITTNLENTSGSLSREKTFEKNILLFGSTGLTGSLVFEYLLDPCFYLNSAVELRELLLEAIEEGLENVTIKTCLYCFNRKIGEPLDKYLKSPSANSFGVCHIIKKIGTMTSHPHRIISDQLTRCNYI